MMPGPCKSCRPGPSASLADAGYRIAWGAYGIDGALILVADTHAEGWAATGVVDVREVVQRITSP